MPSRSARIAPEYSNFRRRECDLAHRSRHYVVDPSAGGFDFRHVMMLALGPRLPSWAVRQVGSYLGYTGRAADVAATSAVDPKLTSARLGCCSAITPRREAGAQVNGARFNRPPSVTP